MTEDDMKTLEKLIKTFCTVSTVSDLFRDRRNAHARSIINHLGLYTTVSDSY